MADFHLHHGAYASALGAIPTWGEPQEGDGFGKYASTSSSIAEITLTANAIASEQLQIAGATITAGASAGVNIFARGANIEATVANIVTLLNSANATAVVGTSVAAVQLTSYANVANQLRNMVFARVKPGNASTLQIMFRIGSSSLNYATNTAVGIVSTGDWATAPTISQFAGGLSGCWGYLVATADMGQGGSIIARRYGVVANKPHVCKNGEASVYNLTKKDTVWCRSNGGITITCAAVNTTEPTFRGSAGHDLRLVIDSNTIWNEDSGNGVIRVEYATAGSSAGHIGLGGYSANSYTQIEAIKKHALQIGFVGDFYWSLPHQIQFGTQNNSYNHYKKTLFFDDQGSSATIRMAFGQNSTANYGASRFDDCKVAFTVAKSATVPLINGGSYTAAYANNKQFFGLEVYCNYPGMTPPPVFSIAATASASYLTVVGLSVTGASVPFPLSDTPANFNLNDSKVILDGVSGVSLSNSFFALQTAVSGVNNSNVPANRYVHIRSLDAGRAFRYEDVVSAYEWNPSAVPAQPTLASRMPDNTAYSVRGYWFSTPDNDMIRGAKFPVNTQIFRDVSAPIVCTQHLMIPPVVLSRFSLVATMHFMDDSTGFPMAITLSGADLVASGVTWDNAANFPTHTAMKMVFDTGSISVRQFSEVSIMIELMESPSTGVTESVFVDPQFVIV